MTKYENNKRVCARGIVFIDNQIVLIERHKKENNTIHHYYTIPGGGVEDYETYEEAAVREMYEETTLKTKVKKYLGREELANGIVYWYSLNYLEGIPTLGGEELERNNPNNHYKVILVDVTHIDNLNILGEGKNMIKKALKSLDNE